LRMKFSPVTTEFCQPADVVPAEQPVTLPVQPMLAARLGVQTVLYKLRIFARLEVSNHVGELKPWVPSRLIACGDGMITVGDVGGVGNKESCAIK
jgi:hypothetical protein